MINPRHLDGRFVFAAVAAYLPGQFLLRPDGTPAVFDGMQGCAIGESIDPMPLTPGMTADVTKKATDTFTAGAVVYYDATNKQATSTATGNTRIGTSILAYASGTTTMHVNFGG